MIKENKVLMSEAREALNGVWGQAALITLISMLVSGAAGVIPPGGLVVSGPLMLGMVYVANLLANKEKAEFEVLFKGFNRFLDALVASLLMGVFTILWSLLLVVPGIIAAIAYSQTFFILAEDESISALDAIKKSKQMMDGYKWQYFYLGLRFFGWVILGCVTLGVGFLWITPYMLVTFSKFHQEVKNNFVGEATTSVEEKVAETKEGSVKEEVVEVKEEEKTEESK